jgi:hypothetical protein
MNEELQSLVERAMAAGRSREQILTVLKDNGLDDAGALAVDSYIKKKSPSALEESASQSDLRPSVSESLSSERVQLGFDEAAIKQQKKAIADAAAAQVYTAVAQTKGDLNKIQDKQAFANAYTTYRSLSDDPRAAALPQNPVTQTGEVDYAVVPTLKKGAIDYVNELIKQEQQRKADLGSKFTVPVLSEVAAGAESIVGGLLKFNEMITGQDSELASFFLDDAAERSRDALIDYGLTEEEISKGFLENIGEGNIGAGLTIFGSTLVQQVPQLAAVAATGGAAGLGLLGASAAGSGYAELQNRSDLSEGEKMLYGLGVGAAEYLAEKLFLGDVNMLRKAFSKEAIEGMTKKELGDMLFGAVPKGVRSVMEEGTEEVLTSVAQQTLAKVIAGEEFNPIEIAESAIYGGAAGGGVYLLSRGVGAIVDPENEAKIRGLRAGLKKTQEAAKDPDLTDQEKEVLGRRAQEYTDGIEQLKRRDDEKVASMTPEDQEQLKSFQGELKAKVGQLRQVKSDEAAEQLKSEVRGLLDNIKQISEKYDRQEEAGVPSPVVEGEAPVEAQPVEGAGQEAPEAGRILQAREEIESRRQEELSRVQAAIIASRQTDEIPTVDGEPVNYKTLDKINAKYDAELAALEQAPAAPAIKIGVEEVAPVAEEIPAVETAPTEGVSTEQVAPQKAPDIEAPKAPEAERVIVDENGEASVSRDVLRSTATNLISFLESGAATKSNAGDSKTKKAKLESLRRSISAVLNTDKITAIRAKNLLAILSNYVATTQEELDVFNVAYAEAEQLLSDIMSKQQAGGDVVKTKAQIIATIKRQTKLSEKQKQVLIAVVNSLRSDRLFNMDFRGDESYYAFASNLLKSNSPSAFVHEVGHWGWYNILTPQERMEYMNYVSRKFMGQEVEGLVFPAAIPSSKLKGFKAISGTNAKDNYQEYFATQFEQWFANQIGVSDFLTGIFDQFNEIVSNLIDLFRKNGYNPDLVKYFDKIVDTTKLNMSDAQKKEINDQLLNDLDSGADYVGDPKQVEESVYDSNKTDDLDIKQESWKDRAKKTWRSFWWSDEQRIIRSFKESLNSQLSRESLKVRDFATSLNNLLNKSDKDTAELVGKVMDGSITAEELAVLRSKKDGQLLFSLSNAMREYIDSLSEDIIFSPAFTKLSEDLQNTILDNLGTYLRGTYRFWKDKRFFPGEETIKAAIEEVYNELYSKEFASIVSMFDVVETRDRISSLEKSYETAREKLIEEERQLPAGEKTTEVKNLMAQLDEIGKELTEQRKLFGLQKELMQILIGTSDITDENIKKFEAKKDEYVSQQIEEAAPRLKAEAKDYVKAYLEEAKKIRESDKYKGLGMVSPSSIKVPDKQFKQKLNLPETFRKLLGEETDPVVRFIDTAVSLSNIKYKGDMILKIATQFKGTEFVKTEATKAEVASGEYRMVTDKFSPLNGKYVKSDVFDAITDRRLYDSEMAWFQGYLNILLLARKSKVIYNIPTWRKNLTGGWWTMMANGVINPEFIQDLGRRGKLLRDKRADADTEALLDIMANYGLLGQGVNANLIGGVNAMYERATTGSDMDYLNSMERLGERVKGFDQWLGDKYSSVDDYTKLVVFRKEIKSFAVKLFGKSYDELTDSEKQSVHEAAAERVKQSTPTFSRLPPFYYRLAQMPLGDFISFEFESFRSFTANFANGYLDIQTALSGKDAEGNTLSSEQKAEYMKSGVGRLMGTAAVFGMRAAIPTILAGMALGDDDELEEDIKALRPNWMEGHSIIPTAITKDGIATTYDYSMEDPYGTIFDAVTDPLSFPGHMTSMLNPNMAVTFLFNLYDSKDIYGKEIVNSYDSPFTKAYKYGGYTLKSLILPPFATSAVRDELRRQELEAERYSPLDAVGRVTSRAFIRDYTFDTGTQLYYFGQQFATKKEQYTDLSGIARSNRLAELEEVRKMYKAIINIGIKKGNTKMIIDANKNIKRQFKPAEEVYILTGYEIPEKQ